MSSLQGAVNGAALQYWKDQNAHSLFHQWESSSPDGNFIVKLPGFSEMYYIHKPSMITAFVKAVGVARKPALYDIFQIAGSKTCHSVVHPAGEADHKRVRSAMQPFFHNDNMARIFRTLTPLCDDLAHDLVSRCTDGSSVQMIPVAQRLVSNIVFGVFIELDKDVDLGVTQEDYPFMMRRFYAVGAKVLSTLFGLPRVLHAPWTLPKLSKEWNEVWATFRRAHQSMIAAKWSGPAPDPDDKALCACLRRAFPDAGSEDHPEHENLIANIGTIFNASFESTSMAIVSALTALALSPHTARALEEELQAADLLVTADREEPRALMFPDLARLQYLDAVVHETLRLFPPFPHGAGRRVTKDIEVEGHRFPKGSEVFFEAFAVHHSRKNWGPDARGYRPERWLEHPGGVNGCKSDGDGGTRWMPFFIGPQNCIGRHIAIMEIKVALVLLVGRLRVHCDAQKCGFSDIAGMVDAARGLIGLDFKQGVWLSFTSRAAAIAAPAS